jgi:CRISPR-associated RAMP protein, Csm3 family
MGIKIEKKIFITGTIEAKTGLMVGGSSIGLEIGGADKVVIRNPLTNQPYIPGSSLKGKMRSLLEKTTAGISINKNITEKVRIHQCKDDTQNICDICKIFGLPAEHKKAENSRLIVRDADLIGIIEEGNVIKGKDAIKKLLDSKNTDMPYTEVKTEVVIDRITSAATPRNFERVPAGAVFGLNMICNIYEGDDVNEILSKVFEGLRLVQDDYIGGSGTRGYGQVKFGIEKLEYKDQDSYEQDKPAQPFNEVSIPQELQRG